MEIPHARARETARILGAAIGVMPPVTQTRVGYLVTHTAVSHADGRPTHAGLATSRVDLRSDAVLRRTGAGFLSIGLIPPA